MEEREPFDTCQNGRLQKLLRPVLYGGDKEARVLNPNQKLITMKELQIIQNKLNAPKGQYNAFGKYKYRKCEDILAAAKPLLAETETVLTLTDDIVLIGDRHYVKATATLTSKDGKTDRKSVV